MSGQITQLLTLPVAISATGGNWTSSPFVGYLWIYIGSLANPVISGQVINFGTVAANTGNLLGGAALTLSTPLFRGTNYIMNVAFLNTATSSSGAGFITATATFDDEPKTVRAFTLSNNILLPTPPGGTGYWSTSPPSFNPNCLHGSSLVQMRNGVKRIDKIESGDEVVSHDLNGNHAYARVEYLSTCWLTFMGVDHDAIIFEKDSLGPNQPDRQLIIDPGHPICTEEEYLQDGIEALRPAGSYWEELKQDMQVVTKKWTDIFVDGEPSVRYDLILEGEYKTYFANGIVVRAKGYRDHRYKEFV